MKEFQDLLDLFPYCLLVLLPVFIAIAPMHAVDASHEFNAHRMTHMDFLGATVGAKIATLSMEARPLSASHVLRKVVVARLKDVSVSKYGDLQSAGCGALLLLVPSDSEALTGSERENVHVLEEHLRTPGEAELPVFYAYETPELVELLETLESDGGVEGAKKSATQTLLDNIISNGYQLVNAAPAPKPQPDQGVLSLASVLNGAGESDTLPTILIVAHTDTAAAAPGLALGADSNGSGVGMLMELARMWGALYRSSKSQPKFNLAFLLSGGGKLNYYGSRKFLEELKDSAASSPATQLHMENLQFVVCLDSLGLGDTLNMMVSKPPKPDLPAARFYADLKKLSTTKVAGGGVKVDMVHKKINLAQTVLSWEHEHYSYNKHSAFTLTRFDNPAQNERNSLLDRQVDPEVMARNTRLVAEALACTMYGLTGDRCAGDIFDGPASEGLPSALGAWSEQMASSSRAASLLATPVPKDPTKKVSKKAQAKLHPTLRTLSSALAAYTGEDVRQMVAPLDREPDYKFYDQQAPIVTNAYRVKPAVFDLVLTVCIAAYVGVVYLGMQNLHLLVGLLTSFVPATTSASSPKSSPSHKSNGNGFHPNGAAKVKAH